MFFGKYNMCFGLNVCYKCLTLTCSHSLGYGEENEVLECCVLTLTSQQNSEKMKVQIDSGHFCQEVK